MTLANLSLPSELKAFVTQKLRDGSYATAEELFTAAVQLLRDREESIHLLKQSIGEGFTQIERGEGVPFDAYELKRAPRLKRNLGDHGAS